MTDATTTAIPALRTALSEFSAFLRRPQLLAREGLRRPGNFRSWCWLTVVLVVGLIGVLLPVLHLWQNLFGIPSPEAFEAFPKEWLVPTVVLVAPLAEELLFRGWQSGTRAALWLLCCAVLGIVAVVLALSPQWALQSLALLLFALVAGAAGWWVLRRHRQPVGWFARAFPVIFYLVAALFALVHLANYNAVSLVTVPMVLPQFWAGLMLGHIRQRIGLIGAIAAHAVANSCSITLALVFG